MRNIVVLAAFILMSTLTSHAQTTASYDNCSALDGASIASNSFTPPFPAPAVEVFTVTELLDTDLVEISISVYDGAIGSADAQIDIGTETVLSDNFSGGETATISYSPTGDQASLAFSFSSTLNEVSTGGIEIEITYSISCIPNGSPATIIETPEVVSTARAVVAFLNERNRRILDERPDRARMVRKQLDSFWGEVSSTSSDGWDGPIFSNFRATPNRVYAHIGLTDIAGVYGADLPNPFPNEIPAPPEVSSSFGCWDAWTESHYSSYQDAGDRDGDFAIGYLGIDCQIQPAIVVGMLAQVDWMQDNIGSVTAQTDGVGWMVGPYMTTRLTPNLFFDVRAAWGRSDNDTDVAGVTASFDTNRWLVDGQLTGSFNFGDVRVSPEISIAYMEERQEAYTDSNSNSVAAQTISAGQLRFGPEISRRYVLDSGILIEPHVALSGIWDFAGTDVTIAGINYNVEGLRGAAEIGVIVQRQDDFNVRISAKYDGIGVNDYQAFGGQLWINIPLN